MKLKCLDNGQFDVRMISREQTIRHLQSHQTCLNYDTSGRRQRRMIPMAITKVLVVVAFIKAKRIIIIPFGEHYSHSTRPDPDQFECVAVQSVKRFSIHISRMALNR